MATYEYMKHFDSVWCPKPDVSRGTTSGHKHGPMVVIGTTSTMAGIVVSIVYQCSMCGDVVVCTP